MKQIANRQNIFFLKFRRRKNVEQQSYRGNQKKKKYQVISKQRDIKPDDKRDY